MLGWLERCIWAAEAAAAACEMALELDVSNTHAGAPPYTKAHLALISCASVCSVLVRALRNGDADPAMVRRCAEICHQCAGGEPPCGLSPATWTLVVRACARCASDCSSLADGSRSTDLQAFGASHDTDFPTPVA